MPEIAKHIEIAPGKGVFVDGEEFPFYVADHSVTVEADKGGIHVVFLPVLVESVTIPCRDGNAPEGPSA